MNVVGIAGHSGMGKTTLLERQVPEISSRGLVASLIKHSHKIIDIDRWALMHELRGAAEPPLDDLLSRVQHWDPVLIEGFKDGGFPTLEVWRSAVGMPTLWPDWPGIVAIASETAKDTPGDAPAMARLAMPVVMPAVMPGAPRFELADTASIAAFVLAHAAAR